ncbi:MAG: T9SS type A sorting domain-containing protein [Bacteroidetes bacterium]|nr:T9SS type A sorting domain-containing protein [Bacteroidota bacterium]MBT6685173.1 T9SS type A sorting domain-containing protein [Bacteroidota bacterium]
MKKILFVLMLVFLLGFFSLSVHCQTTVYLHPDGTSYSTGYINNSIYNKYDGNIKVGDATFGKNRGWFRVPISSIPSSADITQITIHLHVYETSTDGTSHQVILRSILDHNPASTGSVSLWGYMDGGTNLNGGNAVFYTTGNQSFWLWPSAETHLEGLLTSGYNYWTIVLIEEGEDDDDGIALGYDSGFSLEPYLEVSYIVPSCSVSVPSGNTVSSSSGNISFSVTSNGVSNWSASESCNWFSISPTSGNGNGTITISYQENTSIQRSCNITVSCGSSSDTYTLTQESAECEVEVSPQGISQSADAGSYSFSVISNGISNWSASESCNWLSISPSSGNGNGTITITYQENTSPNSRTCMIVVSCGNSTDGFQFDQGVDCEVSVSSSGTNVSSTSGSTSFSVTSNGVSNWSATESCNWLSISPISGNGNGTITITYQENTSPNDRTCTINLSCDNSNASYTLSQDGACEVSVSSSGNTVSSSSGNISFSVTSNGVSNWSASESCNWLSISPTSGNGNGTITITYEENMASLRQCNINVSCGSSTDTYTLTQDQVDAINDVEYFDKINIIPNPNSGRFILEIETAKAIDLQLKLFNVFGQLMYEDKLGIVSGTIKKNVSVGNFPAGVYTIQLSSMESVVSRMILVE